MTRAAHPSGEGEGGFTLVELLVSLLLFALISLAGVGLVETVIGVQQRTETRGDRLAEIQRAFYLIGTDFEQISAGPFLEKETVAFTRGSAGGDYPVLYRYAAGTLYRQVTAAEYPVLTGIEGLNMRFYKNEAWTDIPFTEDDPARPNAVELTMTLAPGQNGMGGAVRRIIELPDEK